MSKISGLWSYFAAVPIAVFSRYNERDDREGVEAGLDSARECMERNGHVSVQYMALVDSQRQSSIV